MKRGFTGDVPAMIVATTLFVAAFMTIVIIVIHYGATVVQ
jgi:hypothetical protein